MRKKISYSVLGSLFFLFFWMNLPKKTIEGLRTVAVSSFYSSSVVKRESEISKLQIENQKLKSQIARAYEWLQFDRRIGADLEALQEMKDLPFAKRRKEHLKAILQDELFSIPADVIYRDPSSWSSTLWVNVGEIDNQKMKKQVIAKNSPVLSEGCLVGVVEHVSEKQSRVRLITDSGLTPAVRVSRGSIQNRELAHQIQILLNRLEAREELFDSVFEKEHHIGSLKGLLKKTGAHWDDGYLAKGEVHGSSSPFWRSRSPILKGIGFNYEYADEEGSPRDQASDVPILQAGDLLVTSGLDGVFPIGLKVGTVIHSEPIKLGSYSSKIDVKPMVSNLNDLQTVFILPPIE